MRSPLVDVTTNIKGFMRSTTAHGFNYIVDSENHWIGRLFWTIVVVFGFTMAAFMITSSWEDFQTHPISTTTDTISVSGIPLPAITIDGGSKSNPWGYVEKIFDQVQIERIDNELQNFPKSALLRKNFRFFFDAIFEKIYQATKEYLPQQQNYISINMRKSLYLHINFPNFDTVSSKLATLIELNATSANLVISQIRQKTLDLFAQFKWDTSIKHNWQGALTPIVETAFNMTNNIKEKPCFLTPSISLTEACKQATIVLLQSSILSDMPYRGLGMGHLMSFFTPRVSDAEQADFLLRFPPTPVELLVEEELISIAKRLFKNQELEMSAFEMAKYVSLFSRDEGHTPLIAERRYNYSYLYLAAWNNYTQSIANMEEEQLRKEYIPCSSKNSDMSSKYYGPCNLSQVLRGQYEAILRIMKYAQQAPHFGQSREEYDVDFSDIDQLLVYPMQNISEYSLRIMGPRIFMCQFNHDPVDMTPEECNLFKRSFTNVGVGYTFNNGRFWDIVTFSENNGIFHSIMNGAAKSSSSFSSLGELHSCANRGTSPFLTLVLQSFQSQTLKDPDESLTYRKKEIFKIGINDPLTPSDLRKDSIDLESGYKHTIYVSASRTVTNKNMKMLDPDKRNCRFRDEKPAMMTLFKEYTQKGCQFECQLLKGLQYCNCIPWNYPQIMENTQICDYMGAYCFDLILSNASLLLSCNCINDCDINMYTYSVSSTALDVDDLCHRDNLLSQYFHGTNYSTPYSGFMRNYQRYVERKNVNDSVICKEVVKGMTIVDFRLASQVATQVSRNMRMTFGDYISNFGGTLGLFTGMSILSLFEFVFWSLKTFIALKKTTIIMNKKGKRNVKK